MVPPLTLVPVAGPHPTVMYNPSLFLISVQGIRSWSPGDPTLDACGKLTENNPRFLISLNMGAYEIAHIYPCSIVHVLFPCGYSDIMSVNVTVEFYRGIENAAE